MIILNKDNYFTSNTFSKEVLNGFGTINSIELSRVTSLQGYNRKHMSQIHSGDIHEVRDEAESMQECDGLFTNKKNIALLIKTADCLPVLFYDPEKKYIGAAHAGWKGTVARICENMIRIFHSHGSLLQNIKVAIGPGIGACSYDIFGERMKIIQSAFPQWPEAYQNNKLNLLLLNYRQMISQGISPNNIDYFPFCTACDSQRFYSYNRDRTSDRMYSYIALK